MRPLASAVPTTGAEPPNPRTLQKPPTRRRLIDRGVTVRAFGVLGPTEVAVALGSFAAVLIAGGWRWGTAPGPALLATASGTAFAAIVLGQLANAYACRSENRPVWRINPLRNRLLLGAVAAEALLLAGFLNPPLAALLGGTWPTPLGWLAAGTAIPAVLLADAAAKLRRRSVVKPAR